MKVFVVGSGGREHVLVWKVKQSNQVEKIYCAPGNGGISDIAECVDIKADDIDGLVKFAKDNNIDLTVIGPEAPLVAGVVDAFEKEGLKIFGPSKEAAQLEGSKVFAKEFMERWGIPSAAFESFNDIDEARDFITQVEFPLVIKADGLAAGKGVFICGNLEDGQEALNQIMEEKVFQNAGKEVVIEECLVGEETSILAISDGTNYVILEPSQDHKRIFDDDLGPNTGGMGAYSPAPVVNGPIMRQIDQYIISPTIKGMAEEGIPFKGVLYAGLMITEEGPRVLEYNVRFGDPETQVVLPRLKTDLVNVMLASCDGKLDTIKLAWDRRSCVCVVVSSGGYPGKYEKGLEIKGLDEVSKEWTGIIFHAGTKREGDKIVTSGGRVLGVTSLGHGIDDAIKNVYEGVEMVKFDHCFFRRDIGAKALNKPKVA